MSKTRKMADKKVKEEKVEYSNLYHSLIARDEKKIKADQLVNVVKRADVQIQSDILSAEEAAVAAEGDLSKAMGSTPFSSVACLEAKRDLADAKDDLKALQALRKELFG